MEVFVDFQEALDTVYHDILLKKLEYFGKRDKSSKLMVQIIPRK